MERDEDGLAGALALALVASSALTLHLIGTLISKGILNGDDLQEICNSSVDAIEKNLGPPSERDSEAAKALRKHVEDIRRIGAAGKL